jgi:hypothetical protein
MSTSPKLISSLEDLALAVKATVNRAENCADPGQLGYGSCRAC